MGAQWIQEGRNDGYIVTEASYSKTKQEHVFVMTKSPKIQRYVNATTHPYEWIKARHNENKAITKIMYNVDAWPDRPWYLLATSDSGTCSKVYSDLSAA